MLVSHVCDWCSEPFIAHDYKKRRFCNRTCRNLSRYSTESPRPERETLIALYEAEQLSPQGIGNMLGVQAQTVRKWLRHDGVPVRQAQVSTRFQPGIEVTHAIPVPERITLEYLYCDWRLTTGQIASHFHVSNTTVGKWLRHHGIKRRRAGIGLISRGIEPPTNEQLHTMIHVERLTYREVADRFGVDQSAVQYWLDRRGIDRPKVEGWQGGAPYQAPNGQMVRSSYEKAVAEWLHNNSLDFVYEPPLPFAGRADFLANGWYIEVWGVINSATYKARKEVKQNLYKAHGLPLIELPARSFDKKRGDPWKRRLAPCLFPPP